MTIPIMEKLQALGWYLSDHGYAIVSDGESITDVQKIIKRALDFDLREIGSGQGDIHEGNIVLQIQKLRNVAAPKNKEDSRAAPRMLKISLTDGKNTLQALEVEHISSISLNTPPGTKFLLKSGSVSMSHGIILLRPADIAQMLGGRVTNLVEKWELNRKLASHTRVRSVEEGGPPPWIPFGKKIVKVSEQDKNFKALADKDKPNKENSEFETQRKDAIAEAAKQGSKKIFGGGTKQLLDHSVQKIVDHGFSIEQAEYALKTYRNNVDKALKSLQKTETKHKEPREPRSKRFEKKGEESKPSSGKISLFDFLEDKLPVQHEPVEIASSVQNNHIQSNEPTFDGLSLKHSEMQSNKGGKSSRGARAYQPPPRHSTEENKTNKRLHNNSYTPTQYCQYNGGGNSQQNKPPRFQRNQETQNYYHQDSMSRGNYQKSAQLNDYRNSFGQPRVDSGIVSDTGGYYKNQQDQPGKNLSSNQNYNHLESDTRNRQLYDASYGRHNRAQDGTHRTYPTNTNDKNYKNQLHRYQPNDSNCSREVEAIGDNSQRSDNHYNNNQNSNMPTGNTWVWRVGDKCLAKYWEDNRYYNAVVTGVSDRTCVVQFKGFENYEEVLQNDCLPITEDDQGIPKAAVDSKRQDQRFNRSSRNEQSQNHISGMEFRRGGSGAGPTSKGYGKKRGQRSSQPIYQPPAQRSQPGPPNTQNNPLL